MLPQSNADIVISLDSIRAALEAKIYQKLYPVGTLYWNKTDSRNPADIFGFGTWAAVTDRFVYASGAKAAGTTGGAETHTLTTNEMPSHTHGIKIDNNNSPPSGSASEVSPGPAFAWSRTLQTLSAGGGAPHNNMPPYVVAYCWERTA